MRVICTFLTPRPIMIGLTWSCRGSHLVHFMLNLNESFLKMELNLFWWCLIVVCV